MTNLYARLVTVAEKACRSTPSATLSVDDENEGVSVHSDAAFTVQSI